MFEKEFTTDQIKRIDELDNATFELIKLFTEKPDLEWDIGKIEEIEDFVEGMLTEKGYKIRRPCKMMDGDGEIEIYNYMPEKYWRF